LGVKKQYGSATNFIKIGNFKDYEVHFPSLSEQKQIVAILDQAFEAIEKAKENTEQNLKNAKEIFESYLQGVFENKGDDWEEKKLGEVCEIRSGRNQKEVEDPKGLYPILGSAGKIMGYANKFICEEGTTIIGRKGTIDKPIFIEEKFWNVDTAFGLHALKELDKRFLFYFCKSYDFTKQDKGSGRPSLVKSDLLQINVPFPPLSKQQSIVRQLDALRAETQKLEAIYTQKLSDLEELKKSLLQKAFAGELVK
jgi:type I restriction enzyme S subunit